MTESTRKSALAERHRALGSDLGDWNGMGVAWSYASDPCDEHDAVRTAAGLFDVSGLKKIHVRGPDSLAVVDHIITRNMAAIDPGKSAYGPLLTEEGTICDDAIVRQGALETLRIVAEYTDRQRENVAAVQPVSAGTGRLQAAKNLHAGRFSRPRRPHNCNEFAA